MATGNTSVATVARVQAWQGDKKKPDEIQKLELTLERTLRHQRAQARATRTESAVVTAVEVERRLGRHLPTRAGPDRAGAAKGPLRGRSPG